MRKSYSIFERLVRKYTGLRVEAEYRFHPARDWAFDFAIPACRLAIEVEGGVHNGGRHIRPDGFVRDMLKYNEAAAAGWFLIRVTPDELLSLKTLRLIIRVARREAN